MQTATDMTYLYIIKDSGNGLYFPWYEILVGIGRGCVPGQ